MVTGNAPTLTVATQTLPGAHSVTAAVPLDLMEWEVEMEVSEQNCYICVSKKCYYTRACYCWVILLREIIISPFFLQVVGVEEDGVVTVVDEDEVAWVTEAVVEVVASLEEETEVDEAEEGLDPCEEGKNLTEISQSIQKQWWFASISEDQSSNYWYILLMPKYLEERKCNIFNGRKLV